jgi:hypothetical protein
MSTNSLKIEILIIFIQYVMFRNLIKLYLYLRLIGFELKINELK